MRTIVHLVAPWRDSHSQTIRDPFNVIFDGDLDEGLVQAAHRQHVPLPLGEHRYSVRHIGYDAIGGATVLEVEVAPYLSEAAPPNPNWS